MTASGASRIVALAALLMGAPVTAQTIEVHIPAGTTLTATLKDATSTVRVAAAPRIVEMQFGVREQGRFRAYGPGEPIAYDRPFLVRVRYDAEPSFANTSVTLSWNGGALKVPLASLRGSPAIFESRELRFEDPGACGGRAFCRGLKGIFDDR